MAPTKISDLPGELLPCIFEYLPPKDLKNASQVCRFWEEEAFSGRLLNRIKLQVTLPRNENVHVWRQEYLQHLSESTRAYRNVTFYIEGADLDWDVMLMVLEKFGKSVVSLTIRAYYPITEQSLRQVFMQVPNLEKLYFDFRISGKGRSHGSIEPFSVLRKLKHLQLDNESSLLMGEIGNCSMAPNLTRLDMDCDSQVAVSLYRHYSTQLRQLSVAFRRNEIVFSFCELRFPQLERFDLYSSCVVTKFGDPKAVQPVCNFFRHLPKLRQLNLSCQFSEKIFISIVENCSELTTLYLWAHNVWSNVFQHLGRLKKLKSLRFDCWDKCAGLEGCYPITSLEELYYPSRCIDETLFSLLKDIAPNLQKLVAITL